MTVDHHPYYCEENIHRLIGSGRLPDDAQVVLITNASRSVACWSQRLAPAPGAAVVWDYHVVAVTPATASDSAHVWDLDSVLPAPSSLCTWLTVTFRPGVPDEFAAWMRPVDAFRYFAEFRSDRSHMRSEEGEWTQPPPPWPAPGADSGGGSNFETWLDLDAGQWCRAEQLAESL